MGETRNSDGDDNRDDDYNGYKEKLPTAAQERVCMEIDKEIISPGVSQGLGGGTTGKVFAGRPLLSSASRLDGATHHSAEAPPQTLEELE